MVLLCKFHYLFAFLSSFLLSFFPKTSIWQQELVQYFTQVPIFETDSSSPSKICLQKFKDKKKI